jgi:hypothetical protein
MAHMLIPIYATRNQLMKKEQQKEEFFTFAASLTLYSVLVLNHVLLTVDSYLKEDWIVNNLAVWHYWIRSHLPVSKDCWLHSILMSLFTVISPAIF